MTLTASYKEKNIINKKLKIIKNPKKIQQFLIKNIYKKLLDKKKTKLKNNSLMIKLEVK